MIEAPLALAFTAGMVATVNPCGFPMLPAYLSYFIGIDDVDVDRDGRVPRALRAAGAVSIGFLLVFVILGLPVNAGLDSVYRVIPWVTIVIGLVMVGLGTAMLGNYKLKVSLPRLDKGGTTRQWRSMVLFGMSYAIASLSCTLPVFLLMVMGTTERENLLSGLLAFVAYGLGMSVVLMALSMALALARESMVRRMRQVLRYTDRVAGGLLVVVGAYLVYYWTDNLRRDPSVIVGTSPISMIEDLATSVQLWLHDGGVSLGILLAVPVVALSAVTVALRRRRGAHPGK